MQLAFPTLGDSRSSSLPGQFNASGQELLDVAAAQGCVLLTGGSMVTKASHHVSLLPDLRAPSLVVSHGLVIFLCQISCMSRTSVGDPVP
jgi:hypothetical protein